MRINPKVFRNWRLPLFLVTLSGLLQFGTPVTSEWLRFEPGMIRNGEVWRLLSAHFVHLSWSHYLMNGIALMAIFALYAPSPRVLGWWMLASAGAVSLGLLWLNPWLTWYVGLSGVLHGLLIAGSLRDSLARNFTGVIMLLAVIIKLIWEQINGPMPGSEAAAGGKVIVDAHLYGAVGGVVALVAQQALGCWRVRPR
jgi:rhomboid family GlyGly-CTERM serine protease